MARKQNLVELEDGIICYTQAGNQNREIALNTISAIRLVAGSLPEVKLLVDYTDSGTMDEEAIQSGFYAIGSLPLDKVAIIGASPFLTKLVTTMADATGKSEMIHFAESREEAIDWLKKQDDPPLSG